MVPKALTNFGVQTFLKPSSVCSRATRPQRRPMGNLSILMIRISQGLSLRFRPTWILVTRDGSPLWIVSGEFERGMSVTYLMLVRALGPNVTQFMAESREKRQCCSERHHRGLRYRDLSGWRCFVVGKQVLRVWTPANLYMKSSWKCQLRTSWSKNPSTKGLSNWCRRIFKLYQLPNRWCMLGAVGQLQFEVFKHRMENEYNAGGHRPNG